MKYETPDKCPVCKSKRHVAVSGVMYDMVVRGARGVKLRGCVDCGAVYIPETLRRRLQKSFDKEETNV